MREIKVGGTAYQVRGLKRKEVKALKRKGFNLAALDRANADDAMDLVFEIVFDEAVIREIDELDQAEALRLWEGVLKETYGAPGEEKN